MSEAAPALKEAPRPETRMRLLTAEEWPKLFPLYADSFPGKSIPLPPGAAVAVLEEDGEIVAAVFLSMVYHMEPAMSRKGYGRELWPLAQFLEGELRKTLGEHESLFYYVTAPDSPPFLEREKEMGREPMNGYVPVVKSIARES